MTALFPQPPGQITLNDNYKYVLDGVEIEPRQSLDLQIGDHWIPGSVFATKSGELIWSPSKGFVFISLGYLMHARWPRKERG